MKLKGGCEGSWARRRDGGVREMEAGPAGLALGPPADHTPWVLCGCVTLYVGDSVCVGEVGLVLLTFIPQNE